MNQYQIVLASASPRRKELLSRIGLSFLVCPGGGEEHPTQERPHRVVEELSAQKAAEVFARMPDSLVIGADTVVACGTMILGKPKSREDACRMLAELQGKKHAVYTGVTVIWPAAGRAGGQSFTFHERTEVEFYPMCAEEIAAYVETGEPMDKAGAYGIQGRCAAYIKGIAGDYNNVVGLPVGRLYQELHKRGLV